MSRKQELLEKARKDYPNRTNTEHGISLGKPYWNASMTAIKSLTITLYNAKTEKWTEIN